MAKRDTYRHEVDWTDVEQAYARQQHDRDMAELMMPERGVVVDECRWGKR